MPIKTFKEFKEAKHEFIPSEAIGGDSFDIWLHSIKNPKIKWAKRCVNRDKLCLKLKKLGRTL